MRHVRLLSITLTLVWMSLLVVTAAQAQTGTIAGTLVEDGTGTPLAGVPPVYVITAYNASTGDSEGVSDAVDFAGHYEIAVPPGSYYVKVTTASFHVRELHPDIQCIAADCPLTAGTPVSVTAGATTTVDFSLAKQGLISGTVRRADDNTPLGDVVINLYNASTSLVASVPSTALTGAFSFNGLSAGTYFIRAIPSTALQGLVAELHDGLPCPRQVPDSDCRVASGTPIVVTAGATTANVDINLDAGAAISGTVVTIPGPSPANGIIVTAYLGEIAMGSALTGPNGAYRIVGLPAGRYRVRTHASAQSRVDNWHNGLCVACPGTVPTLIVTTGGAITDVDFLLGSGATITGSVTCNTPAMDQRGPDVQLFDAAGRLLQTQTIESTNAMTACRVGNPISYTFKGLAAGSYYVLAKDTPIEPGGTHLNKGLFIDQLYGGVVCVTADCDVRKGTPIIATGGATFGGIDITLQPGAHIALAPDFTTPESAYKVYDARGIELVGVVGTSVIGQQHVVIAGLPAGTYYITKKGLLNGGSECLDCPPTAGTPIVVGSGTGSMNTSFATPDRRVSGTITNAAGGGPLSTITVELVSASGRVAGSAVSNVLGHYTVSGLLAGTYFARTVNDRGFVDEVYSDAACGTCDPRVGAPIVVPSGSDVTGRDFVLAAGGVVSGVVSDAVGVALPGVPVSLFAGTTTFAGTKTSSASGLYRATVPAGTYRALAEGTTKHGGEIYSEMPCTASACDPATGAPIAVTTGAITSSIDFTLTSCTAMALSPPLLSVGVNAKMYRQVLSVIGGSGPYVFDVTDGVLPLGLALNPSTGVLSGIPAQSGRSTFRVSAVDTTGCATDRAFALDVQPCAFTLSPSSATLAAAGGNVVVTITNGCGSQDVVESRDWISVQSNTPGQITLTISANTESAARVATVAIGRRAFDVRQAGVASQAPYGLLEVPAEGAQVSGAVAIGGWALDDLEVTRVRIYRDEVIGEPPGPKLIGTAVFIPGARPDVQLAAPGVPLNDRAGFGFLMLTNTLPFQGNGTFRIHAFAEDAEGHSTLLGTRTIVSNNATAQQPFGTIDTPGQGQTISGASYINFGWALTPRPAMIPTDGSTMQVIVDGVPIGTVDYNHFRADVSNTFPDLANSDGPVGFRAIDTTALAEGLHTISWTVTDSRPATAGLGSRYFIVANSTDATAPASGVTSTSTQLAATDVATPLGPAPAPDHGRRAESLAVATHDQPARPRRLTVTPMERVELALNSLLDGTPDEGCPATWAGYLSKDKVLTDLPVGASMDPVGMFYWQTGPGFAGSFPLVFVRTNCRGEKQQIPVMIAIPLGKEEQR